jgi:hypothetical protein
LLQKNIQCISSENFLMLIKTNYANVNPIMSVVLLDSEYKKIGMYYTNERIIYIDRELTLSEEEYKEIETLVQTLFPVDDVFDVSFDWDNLEI